MSDFPKDEVEFACAHSMCAGEHLAWKAASFIVLEDAKAQWGAGRNEIAEALRIVSKHLAEHAVEAEKNLHEYINESHRRNKRRP